MLVMLLCVYVEIESALGSIELDSYEVILFALRR